jgi:transposase
MAWHRSSESSKRLDEIPGVGPALATAVVASVADPKVFRSRRNFSAWVGLVPKQHSSGGKDKLGSISKQGDRYLRSPFTAGELAVIRYAKIHGTKHRPWLTALLARRPKKVAAIALANKFARMAWAMMAKGESYKEPALPTRSRPHKALKRLSACPPDGPLNEVLRTRNDCVEFVSPCTFSLMSEEALSHGGNR